MNLSQVNNILLADASAKGVQKVKKIIRRKKVKVSKRKGSILKPDWDSNNKIIGTDGNKMDDSYWKSSRHNAQYVDYSDNTPDKVKEDTKRLRLSSRSPDKVSEKKKGFSPNKFYKSMNSGA